MALIEFCWEGDHLAPDLPTLERAEAMVQAEIRHMLEGGMERFFFLSLPLGEGFVFVYPDQECEEVIMLEYHRETAP